MKKKVIIVICIFIIIAIGVLVVLSRNNEEEVFIENEESTVSVSEMISIKDKTNQIQDLYKKVDITYPEFLNLEDNYEKYINQKIYSEINYETVYKETVANYGNEEAIFTYEAEYNRYNCGDYISIVINQYIHIGDGRPKLQKKCYVIDANTNSTVKLKDIVSRKMDYKTYIIDEINKQAKDMEIELVGGNGLKSISDNQAFYIKDNKLVIYFEASEIAATAVGELEFVMPFEMIENVFVL